MVTRRPQMATFRWKYGYTWVGGKLSGGTVLTVVHPCRLEKAGIRDVFTQDGKQVQASYKMFCDNSALFDTVDEGTLTVEVNGKLFKVLCYDPKQTHLRIWL